MDKKTYSISFSEYSTFQQCPHKWFLNYVLKIPSDSSEELVFGSSIHNTIESILTDKRLKLLSRDINVIESVYKDNLKKEISEIKDLNLLKKMQENWAAPTFTKQAKELLKELNIQIRFKDYEFVDIEIQLDGMPIVEREDIILTYKGFIDLVLRNKKTGRYLIIDWKTSKKAWDINLKEQDKNFYTQLKLYKYFYSIKKGIDINEIDLAFYNLPRDDPRGQKQYNKEINKIEIDEFIELFKINCENLYDFNHFSLNKAKIMTKKNYCNRCPYNNLVMCNDEQFQNVDLTKI